MTAGDLIRRAVDDGASALGLAKLIAGSDDDKNAEVQRWRFVLQRAIDGAEPNELNARRIGEFFGQKIDRPRRSRGSANDRQAELEADVLRLTEDVRRLIHRVRALERREPPGSPEVGSRSP